MKSAKALSRAIAAALPARSRRDTSTLERPKQAAHGDYATNVALALAKQAQAQSARAGGGDRRGACRRRRWIERAEVAGAGFINFTLTPAARQAVVTRVLAERAAYGSVATHARANT